MAIPQAQGRGIDGHDTRHADRAVFTVLPAATFERVRAIRRRVRLESGRLDGRCGKVAEAIQRELGWVSAGATCACWIGRSAGFTAGTSFRTAPSWMQPPTSSK